MVLEVSTKEPQYILILKLKTIYKCFSTNVIQIYVLVLSYHIIWHNLLGFFFQIVVITLLHGYDPYITFYLHCKCAMFLGAHNNDRNTLRSSIELCLS